MKPPEGLNSTSCTHLGKTFSCPGLRTEENSNSLLPIVNLSLGLLDDQLLGRLDGLGLGSAGAAPDEDDDTADEDGNGGSEYGGDLSVLEDDGGELVGGLGRGVGEADLPLDEGGHEIER